MTEKMTSGDKVEGYKLTDQQMAFQKEFGKIQKVKRFLQSRMMDISGQVQNIRQLFQALNEREASLPVPNSPTHEVPGMEFSERR